MNLGLNACQAMQPKGGTLSIQLQPVSSSQGAVDPPFPQPRVHLTVEDTGCGMDHPTMERIFEPFFTTKEAGHGTGLGLSVVYDIIQGHGGNLQVSSKPGHGSCFQIFLPVYKADARG
jgi:signal transduction histidine kinase